VLEEVAGEAHVDTPIGDGRDRFGGRADELDVGWQFTGHRGIDINRDSPSGPNVAHKLAEPAGDIEDGAILLHELLEVAFAQNLPNAVLPDALLFGKRVSYSFSRSSDVIRRGRFGGNSYPGEKMV